jgi:hypothetical protein
VADEIRPAVRLALFGHPAVDARLVVVERPLFQRRIRAVAALLGCWGSMPILFFIPPHAEWVIGAFFAGIYLAHRHWTAQYTAIEFAGACPRCGAALDLKMNSTLRLPERLSCTECRRTSLLEEGPAADTANMIRRVTSHHRQEEPPEGLDTEELEAYWKRRRQSSIWSPASSEYMARDPWRRRQR